MNIDEAVAICTATSSILNRQRLNTAMAMLLRERETREQELHHLRIEKNRLELTLIAERQKSFKRRVDPLVMRCITLIDVATEDLLEDIASRLRFCELESCGKPFVSNNERGRKQKYCCPEHSQQKDRELTRIRVRNHRARRHSQSEKSMDSDR